MFTTVGTTYATRDIRYLGLGIRYLFSENPRADWHGTMTMAGGAAAWRERVDDIDRTQVSWMAAVGGGSAYAPFAADGGLNAFVFLVDVELRYLGGTVELVARPQIGGWLFLGGNGIN